MPLSEPQAALLPCMSTRRPARWRLRRGILLFEAVLSALVLGVGFVAINHALSSQVQTLKAARERDLMLTLANNILVEMESRMRHSAAPLLIREVNFEPPNEAYLWSLIVDYTGKDEIWGVDVAKIRVEVRPVSQPVPMVSLRTVWPVDWLHQEWL